MPFAGWSLVHCQEIGIRNGNCRKAFAKRCFGFKISARCRAQARPVFLRIVYAIDFRAPGIGQYGVHGQFARSDEPGVFLVINNAAPPEAIELFQRSAQLVNKRRRSRLRSP